jgi:hypothetical protein
VWRRRELTVTDGMEVTARRSQRRQRAKFSVRRLNRQTHRRHPVDEVGVP